MNFYRNLVNLASNNHTMKVTQAPITLDKVLGDYNFQVPLYQREFSWDLEQVSDLYYDLENSNEKNGHFLGSILLYSKDESKNLMEIIDGQQRLTTVFLILYSIKKVIKGTEYTKAIEVINNLLYQRSKSLLITDNSEEPRLVTGKRDKRLFKAILKGEEIDRHKDGRIKSHKLLLNALDNFLHQKIEKLRKDRGIEGVIDLANKVIAAEFIVMTAEQQSDKILLFKTLNARGIELSQSDLIKNEVCNNSKGISEEEAVDLWDDMREILEKGKANVDQFLFHFINSQNDSQEIRRKIEDRRNVKNEKETYPPVPEKYIFDVYDEKLKSLLNTEYFLNDLKKSAQWYIDFINPTSNKIYLTSLRSLNTTKCYPLFLKGKELLSDRNFELLTKAIECISFRHYIIRSDPKDLEKLYYTILNKLKSDNDIDAIIEEIKQHPTMKANDKFKSEFTYSTPKTNISKMILSRIVGHQQESIDLTNGDIWLEHIMPQKPKGEWLKIQEEDPELYEFSVERIGNLTLLQDRLNQGASNKNFEDKKKSYYIKSRLTITKNLEVYARWNVNSVDERQAKLYEIAKDIWKI